MKICTGCGESKELRFFGKSKSNKSCGLKPRCGECQRLGARVYYKKNREKIYSYAKKWAKRNPVNFEKSARKCWLKKTYGITVEMYEEMFRTQNGCCAICRGQDLNGARLSVDHCHKTGTVRGLLCKPCNGFIGYVKENKEAASRMFNYLEKYENPRIV